MNWILIILPFIGFGIGSTPELRFLTTKQSMLIFAGVCSLLVFYLFTDISFVFYFLDWTTIAVALFLLGYNGGEKIEKDSAIKNIVRIFKISMILFYVSIPVAGVSWFFIAMSNDWIGRVEKVESTNQYSIKHTCKNSNFNYSGNHYVDVYKKILLIEYPIDHFNLGNYSLYGFNSYVIESNDRHIPSNSFGYDLKNKKLWLYNYVNGKYYRAKEFGAANRE